MNIVFHIPDEFAEQLGSAGNIEREVLEAFAVQAYRDGRRTAADIEEVRGA